jgi:hypothetical protein
MSALQSFFAWIVTEEAQEVNAKRSAVVAAATVARKTDFVVCEICIMAIKQCSFKISYSSTGEGGVLSSISSNSTKTLPGFSPFWGKVFVLFEKMHLSYGSFGSPSSPSSGAGTF